MAGFGIMNMISSFVESAASLQNLDHIGPCNKSHGNIMRIAYEFYPQMTVLKRAQTLSSDTQQLCTELLYLGTIALHDVVRAHGQALQHPVMCHHVHLLP